MQHYLWTQVGVHTNSSKLVGITYGPQLIGNIYTLKFVSITYELKFVKGLKLV